MTTRRLAAILAADVVGYSAMVGADEPGTLARVRAFRTDVIQPLPRRMRAGCSRPPATASSSSSPARCRRCAVP